MEPIFLSISGVSHFSKTFEDQGDASDINEVNKSANFLYFQIELNEISYNP